MTDDFTRRICCAHGERESRIKDCKLGLFARGMIAIVP
jgi:hypothetical protein